MPARKCVTSASENRRKSSVITLKSINWRQRNPTGKSKRQYQRHGATGDSRRASKQSAARGQARHVRSNRRIIPSNHDAAARSSSAAISRASPPSLAAALSARSNRQGASHREIESASGDGWQIGDKLSPQRPRAHDAKPAKPPPPSIDISRSYQQALEKSRAGVSFASESVAGRMLAHRQ